MYFLFNIVIHDRQSGEVRSAVTTIMQEQGFDFADPEQAAQVMRSPGANLLPEDDPQLLLRSFLISPTKDRWCMVYPSTGWFSETQDLGVKLSQRLDCTAMVLLIDDSNGWGYELSRQGQIVDRFHAQPTSSEALKEKNYRYGLSPERQASEKLFAPTPEQTAEAEKYRGNPSLIAELFGIAEDLVVGFLSRSRGQGAGSHDDMAEFMQALGIDGFDLTPQDLMQKDLSDDWHNLIFVRPMTAVELQWYEREKIDFPTVSPPLWLNDTT